MGSTTQHSVIDQAEDYFPFEGYRTHQQEILHEAAEALFDRPGVDIVVIDAPTGIGKSAINMALGNLTTGRGDGPNSAFYTTPQKKLRNQLQNDRDLSELHSALRGRRDYTCDSVPPDKQRDGRTYNCNDCPVRSMESENCRERRCTYWRAKKEAMEATVATLTFAYLIIDSRLPTYTEQGQQISFDDRELLIIDEAHTLAEQVASLHAGMTLSPRKLMTDEAHEYDDHAQKSADLDETTLSYDVDPYTVFETELSDRIDELDVRNIDELTSVKPIAGVIESVRDAIEDKANALSRLPLISDEGVELVDDFVSLHWSLGMLLDQLADDEPWVISDNRSDSQYDVELKPVYVGRFLQDNVWNRADKIVLSTATMPYRNRPAKWLSRIGLNPGRAVTISKPMPFPAEQRQIRADYQIGNMSSGGISDHWDEIIDSLNDIADKHSGEKGLVHTVSYERAKNIHAEMRDQTMRHKSDSRLDSAQIIEKWQRSSKQMLLTPSMTEGVDLVDDRCRFQVLVKAPYRTLSDPRVNYLVREENDWDWYNDVAAREIIQSVGRAVRNPDDHATYYVLDTKFDQVLSGRTPDWFEDAIVRSTTNK